MKFQQWFAVGILASLPFAATAQQAPERPNPLDANATVRASAYKSAFKNYEPAAADEQESPDKTWRAANDEVGKLGGHVGHMKGEASASASSSSASPTTSTPASTAPVDHGKHH